MPQMPGSGFMGTLHEMLWTPDTRRTRKERVASVYRKGHEYNNNRHSSDLPSCRNTSGKPPTNITQIHAATKTTEDMKEGKTAGKETRREWNERETGKVRPQRKGGSVQGGIKEVNEWKHRDQARR